MNEKSLALLSVSDKTGIVKFAQALHERGIGLLSTGGTEKALKEAGLPVTEVGDYTGFPEMLDGRVKTLHPKIHGGILARRDWLTHVDAIVEHEINPIDFVVVNLYPFRETVANPDCSLEDAIENIDIGGPSMVRAAAKNWQDVTVVVDPADYNKIIKAYDKNKGEIPRDMHFALAQKAFAHTASYDSAIANWLTARDLKGNVADFPDSFHYTGELADIMRYGENPHQKAAFYKDETVPEGSLASYTILQGKQLSYNNLGDSDAAWECVKSMLPMGAPACVIVKHANPCGAAVAETALVAYEKARQTDPESAFGGILAFNTEVGADVVEKIQANGHFVEVMIAPSYTKDALAVLAKKPNVRVLKIKLPKVSNVNGMDAPHLDFKRIGGGLLVQTSDSFTSTPDEWKVVTQRQPTPEEMRDLIFAWNMVKYIKSIAIVYAKDLQTLGVGAGQMSRVNSARIASFKAEDAGLSLINSVAASDAFFPFRDGLDTLVKYGATAVVQPGGSIRDDEVIKAADEHGIAMVMTGMRHFRH
jgi:phosphoribosylaminoimidazolecarboxamide formyltransferase/IMP cyclohydrolase